MINGEMTSGKELEDNDREMEVFEVATENKVNGENLLVNGKSNNESNLQERKNNNEATWRDFWPQITASLIAFSIVIQAGANMGYSSVLVNGLKKSSDVNLKITPDQGSWIASLVAISLPIGSLLVGPMMDKYGRRSLCIATCLPSILSWLILITAKNITMIYTARIIAGIGSGMSSVAIVYVLEITHPTIRAMLLCINSIAVSFGILLTCSLDLILQWHEISIFFAALNVIIFFLLFVIPESPYWLICMSQKSPHDFNEKELQAAENNLRKLNPRPKIYEEEYKRIRDANESKRKNFSSRSTENKNLIQSLKSYHHLLKMPVVYKPLILLLVIFLIQQLSGTYLVIFYGSGLDDYGGMAFLGVIRFIMSIVTAVLSKKFGRRTLMIFSGVGMTVSMLFAGLFVFLGNHDGSLVTPPKWMVLVFVLLYVCTSSLGFAVIPWALIGELFPIFCRGSATGFIISVTYVMMFFIVKIYPGFLEVFGLDGVFLFFSITSLAGVVVVYFFLPETLGKSFVDIEKCFTKEKRIDECKKKCLV